jgi:hypothetical protein
MRGRSGLLLLPALWSTMVAVGCYNVDGPEWTTSRLEVQGTVRSARDGVAVGGATVELGSGGHFSFPRVLASGISDSQGWYSVSGTLEHQVSGYCRAWVYAAAQDYISSSYEDSRHSVSCTPGFQHINIVLEPVVR